jgi:DNA-binding MarR family transcriptional regulator
MHAHRLMRYDEAMVSAHDQELAHVSTWRVMLYTHDRLYKRLADEMLNEHGLDLSWYDVMLHLAEASGPITQRTLGDRTLAGQSGLSRILARMEAEGLIERVAVESDRRTLLVRLTQLGRERLRRAAPTHVSGIKRWFGDRLTARQAEAMRAGLDKVLRGLDDQRDPAPGPLTEVAIGRSMLSLSTDAVSVADAIVVRDALEPLLVADAVRYATARDIGDLRQLVTAMARATDDPVRFLQADWQLHRRIAAITQNEVLAQVYTPLVATLEQNVEHIVPDKSLPAYVQQRLRLHADLVEAIAAADTDAAAELVRQHRLTPADADANRAHRSTPAVVPEAQADHIDGTP